MAQVRIESNGTSRTVALSGNATIGRAPEHALALPDDTAVSRDHARIVSAGGGFAVEDTESRNGTYLMRAGRTVRISATTPLAHGDTIICGSSQLHFEAPDLVVPAEAAGETDPGATQVGLRLPQQR